MLALRQIAPKNDARYYLNGMRVEPHLQGIYLIATDGRVLVRVTVVGESITEPFIVPSDLLKKVSKGGEPFVDVEYRENMIELADKGATYNAPVVTFRELDIEKVIPANTTGEAAHFDPELLARICGALSTLGATAIELKVNGLGASLVQCNWPDEGIAYPVDGVIMPIRF